MRLLFVHWNSDLYGASRSLWRLTRRLAQDKHDVRVVVGSEGPLVALLQEEGVTVEVFPRLAAMERSCFRSPAALWDWLQRSRATRAHLTQLLASWKPDLIHSNTSVLNANAGAARKAGVPHVWHLRETFTEFPALWRFYRPWMQRGATRIINISNSVAAQFPPSTPPELLQTIYNGIPSDDIQPPTVTEQAELKARFNLSADTLTVGVVGRIKRVRKGQETLIEAAALLAPKNPNVRFVVVGSPYPGNESHLEALQADIKRLGLEDRVLLIGDLPSTKEIMALLDIVVMPSALPEPFGNVTVEAMAAARPVVGSHIGATPEIIEDGVSGLLFPPQDATALAQHLERLIADPALRQKMGHDARERFLAQFTFDRTYRELMACYTTITS